MYSPKNEILAGLFEIVQQLVFPFLAVKSVPTSSDLVPRLSQANSFVGIEFPDAYAVSEDNKNCWRGDSWLEIFQNLTELPDDLSYSMRFPGELRRTNGAMNPLWFNWRTDFLFPLFQPGGARNWASEHDGVPAGYYIEGFVFIQQFIFRAFMKLKNSANIDLDQIPTILLRVSWETWAAKLTERES